MMFGFGRGIANLMPLGLIGGICMLIFIALIVVVIVLGVRRGRRDGHMWHENHMHSTSGAEEILKQRLAKGEIDEATYENLMKKIRG